MSARSGQSGTGTYTAPTTPILHAAACECCVGHGVQAVPVAEVVTCKTCGQECSCVGCIAEADDA